MCRSPLQRSLQEIEKLAKEQAGCDFSLSSAQDVANVLFNVLKLPVPPNAKPLRGGKLFSTNAEVSHHPSTSPVYVCMYVYAYAYVYVHVYVHV